MRDNRNYRNNGSFRFAPSSVRWRVRATPPEADIAAKPPFGREGWFDAGPLSAHDVRKLDVQQTARTGTKVVGLRLGGQAWKADISDMHHRRGHDRVEGVELAA